MAKTESKFLSKIQYSNPILISALLILSTVSCQAESAQPQETQLLALGQTALIQTAEPVATGTLVEAAVIDQGQTSETEQMDQCLICHTDQQALMDSANPVITLESESSGEG
jgi:hypothetical protein